MIYLNNAATSWPKAPGLSQVMARVTEELPGAGNRAAFSKAETEPGCRSRLARLFQIPDENRVVFASCATHGLNMGLLGFPWNQNDVVLTTAAEHNAVLRPLYFLQKKGRIQYQVMPVDRSGRLQPETLEKFLKQYHPRMLVFSHASNVTGAVNDVEILSRLAAAYGCVVFLDASQTAGLYPLEISRWNVDLAVITGHKYLLGPQGTGALFVSERIELEPVFTGGTGIHSDEEEMPRQMPLHLEAGTQNEMSLEGLNHALAWQENHPVKRELLLEQTERLERCLKKLGCYVAEAAGERTPVISFASDCYSPEDVGDMLYGSFDIVCRTGLHCAPLIFPYLGVDGRGTVRLSLSRFTREEELTEVEEALEAIFA